MENFNQLCVWEGTVVGVDEVNEFEKFFKEDLGVRVKYSQEIETLPTPNVEGTGGRIDVFFYIHNEDVTKFAVKRLALGVRWFEDVLSNGGIKLYPNELLSKYLNQNT
jgi:hypothetical protein